MTGRERDSGALPPGARFAMSVIHPGSPTLRIRYRQGVLVTPYGFPDWPLCARVVVQLPPPDPDLTLDEVRVVDVLAANAAMTRADGDPLWPVAQPGRGVATPAGWCWAHVGSPDPVRRLALVPVELHGAYRHAGGVRLLTAPGHGLRADPQPAAATWGRGERVPEDLLGLLEQALGWPLPVAYRRYLAQTNGAGPAAPGVLPGHGFVADQPLFGIAREDPHQDLSYVSEWVRDRLTVDFLPIGYVQGGLLAVKVSGDDLDSIWYWDDDDPRELDGHDAAYISAHLLHRCADSIDDLVRALALPAAALLERAEAWVDGGRVTQVREDGVGAGLPDRMKAPWQRPSRPGGDPLTTLFEAR
jgi:hypothetical protein